MRQAGLRGVDDGDIDSRRPDTGEYDGRCASHGTEERCVDRTQLGGSRHFGGWIGFAGLLRPERRSQPDQIGYCQLSGSNRLPTEWL